MLKNPKICIKTFVTSGKKNLVDVTMGGYFHSSELLSGIVQLWGKNVEFLDFGVKPRFPKVPQCREMSQPDEAEH